MIKKVYVTIGTFDCFNKEDHYLVTKMQKLSAGTKSDAYFIVRSNFQAWNYDRIFPAQSLGQRRKNLSIFTKRIIFGPFEMESEKELFQRFLDLTKKQLSINEIIYVSYDTQRDFPCRDMCRKLKIPVKFINYYKANDSKRK